MRHYMIDPCADDTPAHYAETNQDLARRRGRAHSQDAEASKPVPPIAEGLAFVEKMARDCSYE